MSGVSSVLKIMKLLQKGEREWSAVSYPVKKIKDNEGWEKRRMRHEFSNRSGSEEGQGQKPEKQEESNDAFKSFSTFTALLLFLLSQLEECIP